VGLQTGKDIFYIGKQSAKGSLPAEPTFAHGLAGGGVKVDLTQEADKLTSAYLSPAGASRSRAESGAEIETRSFLRSVGLYLLGALGNVVTTGSGTYTHTFDLGDTLPYLACWNAKGDGTILAVKDCKIDELAFEWEENNPLVMKAKLPGGVLSFDTSVTPTVDETAASYFLPVGGTFQLDVDSATPVTTPIKGGSITIKRSASPQHYSGSIEAGDCHEGACDIEVGFTITPDNMTTWRTIATGTSNGSALATAPVYGSFAHTFVSGSASLKFEASRVAFLCDVPDANPEGGAAEVELSGICYRSSGKPMTVTLVNAQASY